MNGQMVCSECGEPARESTPSDWIGAWGTPPGWAHEDGSSLCPIMGGNGYKPCQPEALR
ncbi:hypothetical protein ACFWXR_14210 [[Kitasatospora] papulosa]|uniref:hypothetical protein n=1 Tax=[Kitasatospora] papulosa TaxID=1464011 RepID=UPI003688FEBD